MAGDHPSIEGLETVPEPAGSGATSRVEARLSSHALRRQAPRLARYVLLQRLSAGGMGVVYRGYDPQLDRPVAVKLLATDPDDPQADERRLAEAHALAALSHPHVVRIFDVGRHDAADPGAHPELTALLPYGGVFLVLELVEGRTLAEWVDEGPRDWREIRDAYVQAGRGLLAAHATGLVHHDFKPANAVRGEDGRVRVLDFGLARGADEADDPATTGGSVTTGHNTVTRAGPHTRTAGTPLYMAPEQHAGETTGPATDQFAFCVALWQAIYGAPPFEGDLEELSRRKHQGDLPLPSRPGVPSWVGRSLLRGLRPDPAERWPSMDDLLRALLRDRSRARVKRWGAGLALTGGLAAVAVGMVHSGAPREDLCTEPPAALAGVWDQPRRAMVRSAFEAVPRPYARTAWREVERRLDAHRDQWLAGLDAVCGPEQDDELRSLAHSCLVQRRDELEAMVDMLAEADMGLVDHAEAAVANLKSPRGCTDPAQLRMAEVMPEEPDRLAAVQNAYTTLTRVKVLRTAGRHDDAVALAESVLARVDALGHPPLRAEALRQLAQAQLDAGDEKGGLRAQREAIAAAITTNNHRSAALAWMELLFDEARLGAGYPAARELVPLARVAAERAHDADVWRDWQTTLGATYTAAGEVEQAIPTLEQALGSFDEDDDFTKRLSLQHNLAIAYGVSGDWVRAERELRSILQQIERTLGPGHPEMGYALFNLGGTSVHNDRSHEGIEYSERAIEIFRERYGHHPLIAKALGNIAEAHYGLGHLGRAREAALAALAELEHVEGATLASQAGPLHMLADLEERDGNLEQAHQYRRRSHELEERRLGADNPTTWIGRLHLAVLDAQLGHELEARDVLRRARRDLARRPDGLDGRRWCWVLGQRGALHDALGEPAPALADYERAVTCAETEKIERQHLAIHRKTLALALAEGDPTRARDLMMAARVDAAPTDRTEIEAWLQEHAEP